MKKVLTMICISIAVLIILAIVILGMITQKNDKEQTNNKEQTNEANITPYQGSTNIIEIQEGKNEEHLIIRPRNFVKAMESYKGSIKQGILTREFYKLIVKYIPQIYEDTKLLNNNELKNYYEKNTNKIREMNIYSIDEFINICNDIKTNLNDELIKNIPKSYINLPTCKNIGDNYVFALGLEYSQDVEIIIEVNLSNTQERIEYKKYDELKDVFSKYNGSVTKQEISQQINTIVVNAKKVYENIKDLPLNKILQNYDLNKTEFEKLGIYSREEYLKLTNQLVRVTWLEDPKYIGFTVDANTIEKDETYTAFKTNINYSTEESIEVTMNIINSENLINESNHKIKITIEIQN